MMPMHGGRRRREDDDGGGGGGGGGGGFRGRKRKRGHDHLEMEDRLESLILRLGDKTTTTLNTNIEGLADVLDADLTAYKGKILRILSDCFIRTPEKTTVYSTLVGMMNLKNYSFGADLVETLVKSLKEFLKNCDWYKASLVIRALADMGNSRVVSLTSIIQLFESWLNCVEELAVPQVRRDVFAYHVMTALPWIGKELTEKHGAEFDQILERLNNYVRDRSRIHAAGLKVWSSDDPHPQEEYIDCLWEQIQKMRSEHWTEKHLLRPYHSFIGALNAASVHSLPAMTPTPHHHEYRYPKPKVVFRLFDYTDCPEGMILPGLHSIERFLVEDHVHHIVEYFHDDRKNCAIQLAQISNVNKVPMEYVMVEVIFGDLFRLPRAPYIEVCYSSLLIELCRLFPSTLPQVLAQATELIFDRLATMDPDCVERFVGWFSYHLSNYQFRWAWDDWLAVKEMEPLHPKVVFVKEALLKTMRLSYHKRIAEMVGEGLESFVPPEPAPKFMYMQEGAESLSLYGVFEHLFAAIKQKCPPQETLEIIAKARALEDSAPTSGKYSHGQIELFVQTLLYMGSKSFSHAFAGCAKFLPVLKELAYTEDAQISILKALNSLWYDHQQMQAVLINKLLRMGVIECSAVANWIFSKEMEGEFSKFYIWEILHLTIDKMSKHVVKIQSDLKEARDKSRATSSKHNPSGDGEESDSDEDEEGGKRGAEAGGNEEQLEKLEEQFETAQANQKNLFLIIFQRFIMLLTEHIVRCDTDGLDFHNWWYYWTLGRLKQVFYMHEDQVYQYKDTLETLLFTPELDPNILQVFQRFVALRE